MRREGKEQAAFIAGLQAADAIARRRRNWCDRESAWQASAGIDDARECIRERIRREKAKGKNR